MARISCLLCVSVFATFSFVTSDSLTFRQFERRQNSRPGLRGIVNDWSKLDSLRQKLIPKRHDYNRAPRVNPQQDSVIGNPEVQFPIGDPVTENPVSVLHYPIDPEVYMNSSELLRSKGYPCEDHVIQTTDGYLLGVQRIPHGKHKSSGPPRATVLVVHGLLGSSADFLVNLANESLGYILADAGYDVWLGNNRGNTYSRKHVRLSPKETLFWNFSFDEMARYDLPAMINYITKYTKQSQIYYIGFSEGTMQAFAGFSTNPSIARKVKEFYALGPVTTIGHTSSPLKYLAPFSSELALLLDWFGEGEFMANGRLIKWAAKYGCNEPITRYLCEHCVFFICGTDGKAFNQTRLPVYFSHTPAGTSTKNVLHFVQLIKTGNFQMFDYGSQKKNMKHYNQTTVPVYDVTKMTIPIILYSGGRDKLADPLDVYGLVSKLKNIVKTKEIPYYEHLDFIWAFNSRTEVYNDMLLMMKKSSEILP